MNKTFKIKDIFTDHWDAFLEEGYPIRSAVLKDVEKIIKCGDPSMGHALYHCEHCDKFKYVYFTCKSRFCNSCGAKYTQDRASSITSKLIDCKHRHIVFTIPEELRIFFRKDRSLLNLFFRASADTVLSWFYNQNKSENFKPGFVSTMHTFGRDLKWNPHIHMLLTEGASGNKTIWKRVSHILFNMLRKRWQATILSFLHEELGPSFYSLKSYLFKNYPKGFYVYANPNVNSKSSEAIKYIIRYTGRPAMAQSRILNYDGEFVTFYYDRHEDKKRVTEKIHAFEFIKRLIIHIPDEQFKMIRYYGLYAKKYTHSSKLYLIDSTAKKHFRKKHSHWRARLLLAFGVDPLCCSCGKTMELVGVFRFGGNPYIENISSPLYNST